ncbi:MAG: tetratricopeptide repeat protein, partial [Planctomycetes bacterium]|nr:tetratricopeptide repeat protein [Planctomycetota bacterium]
AFMEAGRLDDAREAFEKYVPNRGAGAQGQHRYWWRIIHLSEIHRRNDVPKLALQALDEITDYYGSDTYRAPITLERAAIAYDTGDEEQALAEYESVLLLLSDPASPDYASALYGKGRVYQDRWARAMDDATLTDEQRRAVLDDARVVWENLAFKLDPKGGDPRLAEALYLAGIAHLEGGEYAKARDYLERIGPAREAARSKDLTPEEQAEWTSTELRAAHALAESFFLDGRYADAIPMYEAAIALDNDSPEIALAHHQLGLCWFRLDDFAAARRNWEIGRARVNAMSDEQLAELPVRQDKAFWLQLYDEKIAALDEPERLRKP